MNNLSKFIFYINIDQKVELLFDKIARRASTRMYEELIDVLLVMKQELVIDSHGIALTTNIDFKIKKSLIQFRFIFTRLLYLDVYPKEFCSSRFKTNIYASTFR